MEKQDRRVRRTHQLLSDALIALALEKGYDNVTIKDITERADVAYVTFFRHYRDKDELLGKRLEEMHHDLDELTRVDNRQSEGVQIFQYIQRHSALYQMLLRNQGTQRVIKQLRDNLATSLLRHCKPFQCRTGLVVMDAIVANHLAVSVFGLIEWWLEHDMPYTPEQMGQIYEELILNPMHLLEKD